MAGKRRAREGGGMAGKRGQGRGEGDGREEKAQRNGAGGCSWNVLLRVSRGRLGESVD